LYEVEAVLNNRPLTYADEEDMETPITPSHLHCGRRTLFSENEDNSLPELTQHEAIGRTKQIEETIQRFWKRWTKEYLLDLREHHKMRTRSKELVIQDVVLIQDYLKKRNKWKMGRVMDVIRGTDSAVRGTKLRTTTDGKGIPTIVTRPLQRLYPLEINSGEEQENSTTIDGITKYERRKMVNGKSETPFKTCHLPEVPGLGCIDIDASQVDVDAPLNVGASQVDVDAPLNVDASQVDVDAPLNVGASQVDADAPLNVSASQVDADAPLNVGASQVDVDAPLNVDASQVDADAPLNVGTSQVDADASLNVGASQVDATRLDGDITSRHERSTSCPYECITSRCEHIAIRHERSTSC